MGVCFKFAVEERFFYLKIAVNLSIIKLLKNEIFNRDMNSCPELTEGFPELGEIRKDFCPL
jgi:hypothetical protein